MVKSINISSDLHRQLRIYAAKYGTTIKKIVENAIANILSAKEAKK